MLALFLKNGRYFETFKDLIIQHVVVIQLKLILNLYHRKSKHVDKCKAEHNYSL